MSPTERLLQTHPHPPSPHLPIIAEAIDALYACAAACTNCADACLAEDHVHKLRRCIRTDLDCADICLTTARMLARQTEVIQDLQRQQLHVCVLACQLCADECDGHAGMHEHCKLCAEACHRCQERCNRLIGEIGTAGVVEADLANPQESPAFDARSV